MPIKPVPMPKLPYPKLEQSPLLLVLGQIRFPAFLKMGSVIPEIQSIFRKAGLVNYEEEQTQQVSFGPSIQMNHATRWVFYDRKRCEAVFLTNEFFVFAVSKYDIFSTFIERFIDLFSSVSKQAELEFATHAGLRFVNLLKTEGDLSPSDQLVEGIRGLPANLLGLRSIQQQTIVHGESDVGRLIIRGFEGQRLNILPPDLQIEQLQLVRLPEEDQRCRILDIDHMTNKEFETSRDSIFEIFDSLHAITDKAFFAAVSPEALRYWKGDQS